VAQRVALWLHRPAPRVLLGGDGATAQAGPHAHAPHFYEVVAAARVRAGPALASEPLGRTLAVRAQLPC
jgi:hypothetical protein